MKAVTKGVCSGSFKHFFSFSVYDIFRRTAMVRFRIVGLPFRAPLFPFFVALPRIP